MKNKTMGLDLGLGPYPGARPWRQEGAHWGAHASWGLAHWGPAGRFSLTEAHGSALQVDPTPPGVLYGFGAMCILADWSPVAETGSWDMEYHLSSGEIAWASVWGRELDLGWTLPVCMVRQMAYTNLPVCMYTVSYKHQQK